VNFIFEYCSSFHKLTTEKCSSNKAPIIGHVYFRIVFGSIPPQQCTHFRFIFWVEIHEHECPKVMGKTSFGPENTLLLHPPPCYNTHSRPNSKARSESAIFCPPKILSAEPLWSTSHQFLPLFIRIFDCGCFLHAVHSGKLANELTWWWVIDKE